MTTTIDNEHKTFNVPNLRFPEFEGEWVASRLSEYLNENKERNKKGHFNKTDVLSVSGDFGIVNQIELLGRSFAGASVLPYHIVRLGNIVYTKSPLKEYPYGIVKANTGKAGIVSTLYAVYSVKDNANYKFIEYYFSLANRANRYFKPIVRIGAKHDMKIGNQEVLANQVIFPTVKEQEKIAGFLSLLDKRISTQNKIIDKLQSLIKGIRDGAFGKLRKSVGFNAMIGDVLSYEQPQSYIVEDTEYTNEGTLVLTANKAFILGYTSEIEGIYDKGDCIIFDDFTLDCKYVDFPFKVKSSAIKILTAKNKELLRYTFEFLKYLDLSTNEHRRHYIAETQNQEFILPTVQIIKTIAYAFSALSLWQETVVKQRYAFEKQKQYLLRQMFI